MALEAVWLRNSKELKTYDDAPRTNKASAVPSIRQSCERITTFKEAQPPHEDDHGAKRVVRIGLDVLARWKQSREGAVSDEMRKPLGDFERSLADLARLLTQADVTASAILPHRRKFEDAGVRLMKLIPPPPPSRFVAMIRRAATLPSPSRRSSRTSTIVVESQGSALPQETPATTDRSTEEDKSQADSESSGAESRERDEAARSTMEDGGLWLRRC